MNKFLNKATSRGDSRFALAMLLLISLMFFWMSGLAKLPVAVVPAFLPSFATAVFLTEGLTGYLLLVQFMVQRTVSSALLAIAYFLVAFCVVLQLLMFPGVFSPTGLLGASEQSAVWLWMFWHGGFPFFILLAIVSMACLGDRKVPLWMMGASPWLVALMPLLTVVGLWVLTTRYIAVLPSLITGLRYSGVSFQTPSMFVLLLNAIALISVIYVTRLRSMLYLWVTVAMCASTADVALTILAGSRYSLGWYGARGLSVISSSVVLCSLFVEITLLFKSVVASNHQLEEHALTDALTGLFNRRHFDEQLELELARSKRMGYPVSVLMVDVDHFKSYNDTFGHVRGDGCLQAVAKALNDEILRPSDLIARYGGEEFVVVLPGTDEEGALLVGERLRRAIESAKMPAASGTVTISVGVAELGAATRSGQSLIEAADNGLYKAKANGRNCIGLFRHQMYRVVAGAALCAA